MNGALCGMLLLNKPFYRVRLLTHDVFLTEQNSIQDYHKNMAVMLLLCVFVITLNDIIGKSNYVVRMSDIFNYDEWDFSCA